MRVQKGSGLIGLAAVAVAVVVASLRGPLPVVIGAVAAGVAGAAIWQMWQDQVAHAARQAQLDQAARGYALPAPALEGGVARFLRPEEEVVAFWPRPELEELAGWVVSERIMAVRLVTGDGGSGKTRLARELAARAGPAGFRAWWVRSATGQDAPWLAGDDAQPVLLIVDYAETQLELGGLLARIAGHPYDRTIRVLLLARSAGDWWQQLIDGSAHEVRALLDASRPVTLGPVSDAARQPEVFRQALCAFAGRLESDCADADFGLDDPDAVILVIHAAALLSALETGTTTAGRRSGGCEVLSELLSHEAAYWEQSQAAYGLRLGPQVTRRVVAIGCLAGADDEACAAALLAAVPELADRATRGKAARWLHDLYPVPPPAQGQQEWLGSLQPDRLAEQLAASVLHQYPAQIPALFMGLPERRAIRALTILARAARTDPATESVIAAALDCDLPGLAIPAMTVAAAANRAVGTLLCAAIESSHLPGEDLERIAGALPYSSVALGQTAVAVLSRLAEGTRDHHERRARWLSDLSRWLSDLGQPGQALTAISEAVTAWRELSAASPRAHLPDLVTSLNNQARALASLGQPEDGLSAADEAVAISRELAAASPRSHLPDLARSLNNQSGCLAVLGRHEDAANLMAEAIVIRRELATGRPPEALADLAASLSNQCGFLVSLGRPAEAIAAITEAVSAYRILAADRPDAFAPSLAAALNNQSSCLADLGQAEDALTAIDEAVAIRREQAATRPGAFGPHLAGVLNNLSNRLADLGRHEKALAASDEAVRAYRDLTARSEALTGNLAKSLANYSLRLARLGRSGDALAAGTEAVTLYRGLAAARPQAFQADLAESLLGMADLLDQTGHRDEAMMLRLEASKLSIG